MAAMTRTLWCSQAACTTRVVTKLSKFISVESAGNRIQQSVERGGRDDAFGGEGADVGAGEGREGDVREMRGNWLRGIHLAVHSTPDGAPYVRRDFRFSKSSHALDFLNFLSAFHFSDDVAVQIWRMTLSMKIHNPSLPTNDDGKAAFRAGWLIRRLETDTIK